MPFAEGRGWGEGMGEGDEKELLAQGKYGPPEVKKKGLKR